MGEPAGVEVTDAGDAQVIGWYRRKEVAAGPPRGWRYTEEEWTRCTGGIWYEKDDGCFIYQDNASGISWNIHGPDGSLRYCQYFCYGCDGPPAEGWELTFRGRAPAPTLRVVD